MYGMQKAMIASNKLTTYFSLLPTDIKKIVYTHYKNPHCSHTNVQQHFAAVVDKKSEKEKRLIKATKLLFFGANPNTLNEANVPPLVAATQNGDLAMVCLLLEFGATPDCSSLHDRYQAFHYAAVHNEWRIGKALINAGARVDYEWDTYDQITVHPLHVAARYGSLEMMEIIYGSGAKICRKLWKQCLERAIYGNHSQLIPFIVSQSDVVKSKYGPIALRKMVQENKIEVIKALLKADVDPNKHPDYADRLITIAAKENLEAAQLLLAHGASVEQEEYDGKYDDPLITAIKYDNVKMVRLLIPYRKKIDPLESWAPHPLAIAWQNSKTHPEIFGMLRKAGAKLS
jgi:ankyrin repeat protein